VPSNQVHTVQGPLPGSTITAMEASDAELLTRWRGGDATAGEELFDRYYAPLERFFLNKLSTGIADLVQETMQKCLAAREFVDAPDKFRSYLFSIAYNTLYSHLRTRQRHGEAIDVDAVAIATLAPGPSSVLSHKREQRLLLEGLRRIPVADQVILELHYWESLDTAEIAAVLGRPRNTIKGQLQRARKRLEAEIARLSGSAEVLRSTLSDLDSWAAQCQRLMGEPAAAGE
jgi:RNA polymerase sigma-70 factor (ECF subfamily)